MRKPLKDAITICKTILRNGYDAHIINAPLHERLLPGSRRPAVDLASEADTETLCKLFPRAERLEGGRAAASMEQDGVIYRFYPLRDEDAGHPELSLRRITPTLIEQLSDEDRRALSFPGYGEPEPTHDRYEGFRDISSGVISFVGLPDETLRHNYLLAVRALRFAANFDLPIEPNTWMAIVRASTRVLDYASDADIMDEWRKVSAESLYRFVQLMFDAHILQGLIPEVAALTCVRQKRNESGEEETVFAHTLACMKRYPEEDFHYDWLGTMAMMFHDVGKLYTGEYAGEEWSFYQHHRVGAKVTRMILRRLHFSAEDIDLLVHLVKHHMHFKFMLTDRGIRRFKALDEYPRLIAMASAEVKARDGSSTSFNHNMKYLERADTPEQMLEPLLNGNEIMEETRLRPGPLVGILREALLQAQIAGDVTDAESARAFVRAYAKKAV